MAHYPADTFQEATEIAIEASNQLHGVINGDANAEVTVEDGSKIPSVRKAMVDSLYFKPPIAWAQGEYEDTYNQLREFIDGDVRTWWFAKGATVSTPVLMSTSPATDINWTLWSAVTLNAATYETQKRLAAEAGLNMVGSFLLGATVTTMNDVVFYETDGKYYGWGGSLPKVVPDGSTPATTGGIGEGAWVDRTDVTLRFQVREVLLRSYAEAGYNLVDGSFEAGGTLVNANDVLLQECTGKAFSGPAGTVAAGTNPASGGFVDASSKTYSCFKTVAEMKASPMVIGQPVQWLGYYAPMDGGGNSGIVSARGSLVEDGGSVFFVAGNLAVVAKESKSFHIRQFGAKYDDALFDNGPIFKKIAEINKSCYMDNAGIIHASTEFDCPSCMASMLGNATIKLTGNLPKIVKPITKFKSVGFSSDVVARFANNAPLGDKEVIIDGGVFDKFKITAYRDTTGITKLTMKNWWEIKNVDTSSDVIEVDSSDYVITQGTIIGGREGIKSNKASQGGEITHLDISGCFLDAIDVYTGGKRVIITHNKLHNNTGGGLDLKVATNASPDRLHSRESIVGFNICHDNAKQGLTVSAPFISVVSNQCSNNGEYGILAGQAPDAFGCSLVANTCTNNGKEGILISQPNSIVQANQLMDNDKVNIGVARVQLRAETGCTNGVISSNVLGYTADDPLADNRGIYYSGVGDIVKDNQFRFVQKSKQISGSRQSAKIMRDNGENSMRRGNTASRPTAPAEFEPYYNTDTSAIERFIGGVWV